jgi:hypothetical protein
MRRAIPVFALFVALVFAPAVQGAGKKAGHERTVHGMLASVDPADRSITISKLHKKGSDVTDRKIKVDDGTKVIVNGQPAKLSALTIGQSVKVTIRHGVATEIEVSTSSK